MTDSLDFQKSITDELDVIQNRVRNLIGSANWGEDGRYKEAILRKIIRRFLPSYLSIGTGFVVDRDQVSKQIDIINYYLRQHYPAIVCRRGFCDNYSG